MDAASIVAEIESRAAQLAVQKAPFLRALRREYSTRLEPEPAETVLDIAEALVSRRRVHRFMGDELIAARPDAVALLDLPRLERLGAGISTWDQVDCFALFLSGPAWREGRISDAAIALWAHSPDRWWRRAAVVSTVPLNLKSRGGRGDTPRTLAICRLLLDDRDPMVVKALSWALRALAVRDPDAVRRFLDEHAPRLAALVRREVLTKLTTGRKARPGHSKASTLQSRHQP